MEDYFFGVWRNGGSTETNDRPTHRPRSRSRSSGGGGGGDGHDGSCGVRVSLGSERKNERTNERTVQGLWLLPSTLQTIEGGREEWRDGWGTHSSPCHPSLISAHQRVGRWVSCSSKVFTYSDDVRREWDSSGCSTLHAPMDCRVQKDAADATATATKASSSPLHPPLIR